MFKNVKINNKIFFKFTKRFMFDFDPSKDYYKILGISSNSSEKQLKDAYHKLAKKYHPDLNQGKTSENFKEINAAYNILSDQTKRRQYDEMRNMNIHKNNHDYTYDYKNQNNEWNNEYKSQYHTHHKTKFTFRDPNTGQWKTYYSSDNNKFYDDIKDFMNKINQNRKRKDDFKNYWERNNDYSNFNNKKTQFRDTNDNNEKHQDYRYKEYNFYNNKYKYHDPYGNFIKSYMNIFIMFGISILFFTYLRNINKPTAFIQEYDNYVKISPYPPEYISPIYNKKYISEYNTSDPYINPYINPKVK